MEAHWLKDIKTDFGGRVVLTRETEVFKQVRNEKRKEKLVGSARSVNVVPVVIDALGSVTIKKGRKMVGKVTS